MGTIGFLALALVITGGYLARRRVISSRARRPRLNDDLIRRIEEQGRIDVDEPLDLEAAREAEEEFWEETAWEEPDEY